ncbi:hypothetical protein OBBRIDRAFT_179154 [Obba rivulosa]|uniref:Uncharacterized protein n=1 Tax=Obba rivulosa TaxID=1052685 RepID=A0A8E2J673_9APHY|nr:hypothetical protein OBBRIDRAFT_179154 [Obba rivulosa]
MLRQHHVLQMDRRLLPDASLPGWANFARKAETARICNTDVHVQHQQAANACSGRGPERTARFREECPRCVCRHAHCRYGEEPGASSPIGKGVRTAAHGTAALSARPLVASGQAYAQWRTAWRSSDRRVGRPYPAHHRIDGAGPDRQELTEGRSVRRAQVFGPMMALAV